MDEEMKKALEAARKAHEEFKAANDLAAQERKETGRVSAELQEKIVKIEETIEAKMEAAQKRWDEIERRVNRGELFGGVDSKAEARALELKAFNRAIALMPGGNRQALTPEAYQKFYKPAFAAYMRGKEAAVANMGPEFMAALSVASDPAGGYQVPADITDRVVTLIYETSAIRKRAAVRRTGRDRIEIRRDLDQAVLGGWTGEGSARAATATPQTPVPYEIPVHEQYAFPLITQKELDDADFDIEGWLVQKLVERFLRDENSAFVDGNGVMKPRGFLSYASAVPSKAAFERIQQVATGVSANFAASNNGPDIFIDLLAAMKENYTENASWAMTRTTLAAARKLKNSYGEYQVQISLGLQGRPGFEILGFPVDRFQTMPEIGANSLSIALADWAQAYQIVDHVRGLSILRDPYTQKPNVGLYATKRVGGDVANFEAIKLAKFGA